MLIGLANLLLLFSTCGSAKIIASFKAMKMALKLNGRTYNDIGLRWLMLSRHGVVQTLVEVSMSQNWCLGFLLLPYGSRSILMEPVKEIAVQLVVEGFYVITMVPG